MTAKAIKRKKKIRVALLVVLAVALVALVANHLFTPENVFKLEERGGAAAAEQLPSDRLNLVLLGFDGSEKRSKKSSVFRTDTIMIASLNFKDKTVSLVSIPRDSYVKIANTDIYDKINHSYVHGYNAAGEMDKHQHGIDTTIRTIEDFLGGIPIHYYIAVDMDGVAEVVDRVGGVHFDVPYTVRTKYGRGRLLVEKGYQLLDGQKFLNFIRDRSVGGDFGRVSRQQEILIEAFRQIKERGKLRDVPSLYRSLQDNVKTSLNAAQIAQLALFGLKVSPDQITNHTFTGSSQYDYRGGQNISYVVIDEGRRVELVEEVFGVAVPSRPQITLSGPKKTAPLEAPSAPSEPASSEPEPPAEQWPGEPEEPAGEEPAEEEEPEQPGETADPVGEENDEPDNGAEENIPPPTEPPPPDDSEG